MKAPAGLGGTCTVVVVVDVLSYSTTVVVAVERGAGVLPFAGSPDGAATFAAAHGALLAGRRGPSRRGIFLADTVNA